MMKLGEPKEEGMSSPAPPKRKNSGRTRRRGISKIYAGLVVVIHARPALSIYQEKGAVSAVVRFNASVGCTIMPLTARLSNFNTRQMKGKYGSAKGQGDRFDLKERKVNLILLWKIWNKCIRSTPALRCLMRTL